ncbi:MAG: hypothetical protein MZV70_59270 [Desulfobacterales bacterium]|nr:hypothetical protein [Desulfobacterales bacterium]
MPWGKLKVSGIRITRGAEPVVDVERSGGSGFSRPPEEGRRKDSAP